MHVTRISTLLQASRDASSRLLPMHHTPGALWELMRAKKHAQLNMWGWFGRLALLGDYVIEYEGLSQEALSFFVSENNNNREQKFLRNFWNSLASLGSFKTKN